MIKEFVDNLNLLINNVGGIQSLPLEMSTMCERYLEEDVTPDIVASIKLAMYFNCSLDFLFGLSNNKGSSPILEFSSERFFENYTKLLEKNGLSHWRFAHNTTISESSARKWKKGTKPSVETLIKIAKLLNSSIDYLVQ